METTVNIREPVPAITDVIGPRRICPETSYEYLASPAAPGTFNWAIIGGTLSANTGSKVKVTWLANQPLYSLSVTRTLNGCTSDPFILNVTDIGTLALTVTGDNPVCADGVGTYTANIDGADEYYWYIIGDNMGSIINGAGTPQIEVLWHAGVTGQAQVQLTARVCGDDVTVFFPVTILPLDVQLLCPNANSVGQCRVCQGNPFLFEVDNENGSNYDWFIDDVLVASGPAPSAELTFADAGTHFVRVRMTGSPACPGITEDVLAVDVVANPEPIITQSTLLDCINPDLMILNATTYPGADAELFEWKWPILSPPQSAGTYFPIGPQLFINSNNIDHYRLPFSVMVTRFIEGLECTAESTYFLDCATAIPPPNPSAEKPPKFPPFPRPDFTPPSWKCCSFRRREYFTPISGCCRYRWCRKSTGLMRAAEQPIQVFRHLQSCIS